MSSVLMHPLGSSRFTNLVRMVARYGCDGRYVPRLLGVALQSMLRQPVMWYESARYGRAIAEQEIAPDPIFVIGHWRSGTTHLQNILSKDPQFASVTLRQAAMPLDFLSLGGLLSGRLGKSVPRKRLMDNVAVDADAPWEEELALASTSPLSFYHVSFFPRGVERIFRDAILFDGGDEALIARWRADYSAFLRKVQSVTPSRQLLLKNPANGARIALLLEQFPRARFVHIHRDPCKVFASTVHLYLKAQQEWGFHRADRDAIVEHVLASYPQLMNAYFAQRETVPANQLTEVRFSDLQSDPIGAIESIYASLQIPGFEQAAPRFTAYLESISDYRKNRLDLSPPERAQVAQQWGKFFEILGYDQ